MIFVDGLVHCDMHEGNLRFLPDGRAALIDFGFMAEMRAEDRVQFTRFFHALATRDARRCAGIVLGTAIHTPPGLDHGAFESAVARVIERASGASAGAFDVAGFVLDLFDVQRRHGVHGTPAFMMAIVSLLVLEGVTKEVDPALDFQREAYPYLLRASLGAQDASRQGGAGAQHDESTYSSARAVRGSSGSVDTSSRTTAAGTPAA
jgi:ubiquinone biosynthesis protein